MEIDVLFMINDGIKGLKAHYSLYYKIALFLYLSYSVSIIVNNTVWLVGNGSTIKFRTDNWLGSPLVDLLNIPRRVHRHLNTKALEFCQSLCLDNSFGYRCCYASFGSPHSRCGYHEN
jgi:hypothetical protein